MKPTRQLDFQAMAYRPGTCRHGHSQNHPVHGQVHVRYGKVCLECHAGVQPTAQTWSRYTKNHQPGQDAPLVKKQTARRYSLEEGRQRHIERVREWQSRNPDRVRQYQQDYYYRNPEAMIERARQRYHREDKQTVILRQQQRLLERFGTREKVNEYLTVMRTRSRLLRWGSLEAYNSWLSLRRQQAEKDLPLEPYPLTLAELKRQQREKQS